MCFVLFMDIYPLVGELVGARLPELTGSNVAHSAHLGGALFGWIYFKRQLKLSSLVKGVGLGAFASKSKPKARLRVFEPKTTPTQPEQVPGETVDAILAKISAQGESSLTDREREILSQASRQYRGQ